MVVSINGFDRKISILTQEDVHLMRINILNRLIDVLNDYIKLPDLDKDEVSSIRNSMNELREKIRLTNYILEKNHE